MHGHSFAFQFNARRDVARIIHSHNREEAYFAQGRDLDLRLGKIGDQRLSPGLVRTRNRDSQTGDNGHKGAAFRSGWNGHSKEVVWPRLESILQTGSVIPGNPDFFVEELFLHKVVRGGLRVDVGPKILQPLPALSRIITGKGSYHAAGEGWHKEALEEAMQQTTLACRESELGIASGIFYVLSPSHQIIIGQGIDIRAGGQVVQSFFVDGKNVSRLHPRHVVGFVGVELGYIPEGIRDAAIGKGRTQGSQVLELILGAHR